jgi:exonuclease III
LERDTRRRGEFYLYWDSNAIALKDNCMGWRILKFHMAKAYVARLSGAGALYKIAKRFYNLTPE